MHPVVENDAAAQEGLGEKLVSAVVPDVVGVTLVSAVPVAVYPVPDASSVLPVMLV